MMTRKSIAPNDRLIVALDVPTLRKALRLVDALPSVQIFKIGLEAYAAGFGDKLRAELGRRGRQAMIDLKLHDIPETVTRTIAALNDRARFVTVHATGQGMKAAQAGTQNAERPVAVLAVTVLTSLTDDDLAADGYILRARALVAQRALKAAELGLYGVVASPQEVELIRAAVGDKLVIVTPGIRPAGADPGDQKRVGTPEQAIRDGADYLVVGRPIRDAKDPHEAALSIQRAIAASLTP